MEVRVGDSVLAPHSPSFQVLRGSRNEVERWAGVDRCVNHEGSAMTETGEPCTGTAPDLGWLQLRACVGLVLAICRCSRKQPCTAIQTRGPPLLPVTSAFSSKTNDD